MSTQDQIQQDSNPTAAEFVAEQTTIDIDLSAVIGAKPVGVAREASGQRATACLIQIHPIVGRCGVHYLGPKTVLGRESDADLCIHMESVSRHHAKIEQLENGGYRLTDLDSTNGTFVNDTRVRQWDLEHGDVVRCGGAILKVLPSDDLEARYHEIAYMMMTHDSLTGINNRQFFEDTLKRELAKSYRYNESLCVLMMDLDHFKAVNDLHGHLAGDDILREFAKRTNTVLRNECVFARLGGEEFGVIVQKADREKAAQVAERIRAATANKKFRFAEGLISVSVSIGIAVSDGTQELSVKDMLGLADERLYQAKQNGRDCVVGEGAA